MSDICKKTVLIISPDIGGDSSKGRMLEAVRSELEATGTAVRAHVSSEGVKVGLRVLGSGADAVMVDWNLPDAAEIVRSMRSVDPDIGIFLMVEPDAIGTVPHGILPDISEYLWLLGDTPSFIAGRVEASMRRYRKAILPPMFGSLIGFSGDYEHSWHTPGHAAGTAFLKSPVGRLFHAYFGERLLRSDLSVSVRELGSLLDHSGPIGEAERYAAKVFGSDLTYFVTNGTSASNRIVGTALASPGDTVVIDRNCHRSVEHAIAMGRTVPVYLMPSRNRHGMIGPVPAADMHPDSVREAVGRNPLVVDRGARPSLAVLTNSTYDGIIYDAAAAVDLLGGSADRVHFDEAWHGHARFNPFYADRYAMHPDPRPASERPTVVATQSAHKVLAALSQASMIHIRQGRRPVDPALFNESYMMHASTSPLYAILASLDVTSKMMDAGGRLLTRDSLEEAVRFRQTMARAGESADGWWFGMWQPDEVEVPGGAGRRPFAEVPAGILAGEPGCWMLHPDDGWHGFDGLDRGWAMLDPVKVTVLTPGMGRDGEHEGFGIPAAIVAAFLEQRGIVCEKTGDYSMLFLFTMGVTNGRWGTLVAALSDFKRLFDTDELLDDMLPDLVAAHPQRYAGMGVAQLAAEMHGQMRARRQTQTANAACATVPEPAMTPAEAYTRLVRGEVEQVPVADACGRIAATGIVPYPPGIPLLMPGELTGCDRGSVLGYLRALEEFDRRFPGFGHESQGVTATDSGYRIHCIRG